MSMAFILDRQNYVSLCKHNHEYLALTREGCVMTGLRLPHWRIVHRRTAGAGCWLDSARGSSRARLAEAHPEAGVDYRGRGAARMVIERGGDLLRTSVLQLAAAAHHLSGCGVSDVFGDDTM